MTAPSRPKSRTPPPPVARPGPGRPAKFGRTAAVDQALGGFWTHGFAAMNVSALAAAMGIERSSFYNSFGDREAVFAEALRRYTELTPDRPLAEVKPGEPVTPVLVWVFREVCRVRAADSARRGCLLVNSIVTLVGGHPELGPMIAAGVRRQRATLERLLRQAAAQGEIARLADPAGAAGALTMFLIGLNVFARVEEREAALWSACRHHLQGLGFAVPAQPAAARA